MALLIKGISPFDPAINQSIENRIINEAEKHGISKKTVRPIRFEDVSAKIGDEPALLMLSMLSMASCSKEGIEATIDVMNGIAGEESISVAELDYKEPFSRPLNFVLGTNGFLKGDFENHKHMYCSFRFTPEVKYNQSLMRDRRRSFYQLDLEIELFITVSIPESDTSPKVFDSVQVASAVVEFDGPSHLQDEKVRADKERDSMVQGLGKTVFRIQTPYKTKGTGSTDAYKSDLAALVNGQIADIKEFFRKRMYQQFEASKLINAALEAEKTEQV